MSRTQRLFWAACLLIQGICSGQESRPNIVFIVADTLRADHLRCYGYSRETSPAIDRLAAGGVRVETMYTTSSWTLPSLMSMFTGVAPSLHRATTHTSRLAEGLTTLAAELQKAGYECYGVVANPVASGAFGFARGFTFYDDMTIGSTELNQLSDTSYSPHTSVTGARVTRICQNFLNRRDKAKPYFLFALYYDCHADYIPPRPYDTLFNPDYAGSITGRGMYTPARKNLENPADRDQIRALYDGEIRYTDEQIGKLIEAVNSTGQETCIALTADHGEEFWDHGGTLHGHTLYDELIHVPFILHWPGKITPGSTFKPLAGGASVMPTLLDVAGVPVPKQATAPSLLSALRGGTAGNTSAFFETEVNGVKLRGVRNGTFKYIEDLNSKQEFLFDLSHDPDERTNAVTKFPAQLDQLKTQLRDHHRAIEKIAPSVPGVTPNARLLEQLKDMGYAQ